MVNGDHIRTWIENYRVEIDERADELNKLDAALGDGDFGASMQRGLNAVATDLKALESDSIGELLRTTGATIVSAIGGTSGPLVGSLFLKAGIFIGNVETCDANKLVGGLRAGADGVMELGGAKPGDKTMLDALVPAVDAMEGAEAAGGTIQEVLRAGAEAAEQGAEASKELAARRGRASYTGDGGVGHLDPGAQGVAISIAALERAVLASVS